MSANAIPAHLKTRGGYQVSTPTGDEIVVHLNGAEVLRINLGNSMIIKSSTSLTLEAPTINIKAGNTLSVRSGGSAEVKISNNLSLESSAAMTLRCGSNFSLTGATVNVNNGALEVT